jgi:hypothetical protein
VLSSVCKSLWDFSRTLSIPSFRAVRAISSRRMRKNRPERGASGRHETRSRRTMAERPVLVGLVPQVVVLDPGDQISWISDAGNLRVEFDVNRCPFSSNIFQAPAGMRLLSGPPRVGLKGATYKYRLWLNDQLVGQGEVILREK